MNHLRKLHPRIIQRTFHRIAPLRNDSYFDPPYLEAMKPKTPLYDTLNIQLKGHDYPIIESYQKFVHKLMKMMDISVEDSWGVPAQEMQVTNLKAKSELVTAQYNLRLYERTVQITDIMSYQLPLILRSLEASAPPGVSIKIIPHEEWHEEVRYVPDTELNQLKQELEEMGGPLKKK